MTVKSIYQSDDDDFRKGGVIDETKSRKYSEDSGNSYRSSLPQDIWSVDEGRNSRALLIHVWRVDQQHPETPGSSLAV